MKTIFRIGDRVTDGGRLSGTVVCVIETGEFSAGYNAAEWGYLETGVIDGRGRPHSLPGFRKTRCFTRTHYLIVKRQASVILQR